jgi:hypothetical protein
MGFGYGSLQAVFSYRPPRVAPAAPTVGAFFFRLYRVG